MIGASCGIAVSPFDGEEVDQLVRNADLALYAAKHGGRGGFRFFSREFWKRPRSARRLRKTSTMRSNVVSSSLPTSR